MSNPCEQKPIVFIGRDAELRQLKDLFDAAQRERSPKIVLIEGDVGVGKTALLHRFLSEAVTQYPEAILAEGKCAMETELSGLVPFSHLLMALIGLDTKQRANSEASTQMAEADRNGLRVKLRQILTDRFSEEELRTVCFDLGLDYDDLPAQGKAGKARELVAYSERSGHIAELIDHCQKLRPNASLKDTPGAAVDATKIRPMGSAVRFLEETAPAWLNIVAMETLGESPWKNEPDTRIFGQSRFGQEHIFIQYVNALSKMTTQRPAVAIIDDLHWADTTSLKLLFHVARNLQDAPLLLICAYRPYEALNYGPNKSLFGEVRANLIRHGATLIELVEGIKVSEYVASRYPTNTFPTRVIQEVQEKTGGHALFVSELFSLWQQKGTVKETKEDSGCLIWKLSTEGDLSWVIPPTLGEVLAERWCRIEEEFRKILSCASVEGEEFTAQVVASLIDAGELTTYESLEVLEQSYRLIKQKTSIEIDSGILDLFRFSHRFIREYIYSQLSIPHRRLLHRQVGECLEKLYADHREIAGQLVRHFSEANESVKCAEYALLAARSQQSRYAWSEGEQLCELGLRMALRVRPEQLGKTLRLDLLEQSGHGFHESGDFSRSQERYEEALRVAQELSVDPKRIAMLLDSLGELYDYAGQLDQAEIHYIQARQLLDEYVVPFSEVHASIDADLAYILDRHGRTEEAIEAYRQILTATNRLPPTIELCITRSWLYNYLGIALGNLGQYSESRLAFNSAIELARATSRPRFEVTCILNLADDCLKAGLVDESFELANTGLESARRVGDQENVAYAMNIRSAGFLARNQPEKTLEPVRGAMSIAERIGSVWDMSFMHAHLAQAHQKLGHLDAAYHEALRAVEYGKQVGYRLELGHMLDVLAQIEAERDDWVSAQQHFSEAIGLLREGRYRHIEARTKHHLAKEFAHRGDHLRAIVLLQEALVTLSDLHLDKEADEVRGLLILSQGEQRPRQE